MSSGPLRKILGPTLATITKYTEICQRKDALRIDAALSPDELRLIINEYIIKMSTPITVLSNALKRANDAQDKWNRLESKEEAEEYEKFDTKTNMQSVISIGETELTMAQEKLELAKLALSRVTSRTAEPTTQSSAATTTTHVRLPQLTPKKFDGNVLNYRPFIELFHSSIGNVSSIPQIEKMNHLVSLLEGDARLLAESYLLTADNYTILLDELERRFGNSEALTTHLLRKLNTVAPIHTGSDGLRKFVFEMKNYKQQLEQNHVNIGDEQFELLVTEKLPRHVYQRILDRKQMKDEWDHETFITELLKILEMFNSMAALPKTTRPETTPKFRTNTTRINAAKSGCLFCDDNHASRMCDKFTTPAEKVKRLIALKRCFRCLKDYTLDHRQSCKGVCRSCGKPHHSVVCGQNPTQRTAQHQTRTAVTVKEPNSMRTEQETEPLVTTPAPTLLTTATHHVVSKLPIIRVQITNPELERSITADALLDTGSDCSYVKNDLIARLGLKPIAMKQIRTETFGGNFNVIDSSKVRLRLNDTHDIELYSVPKIIGSTYIREADATTNRTYTRKADPAVLIGMDNFFKVGGISLIDNANPDNTDNRRTLVTIDAPTEKHQADDGVDHEVPKLWDLDGIGLQLESGKVQDGIIATFNDELEFKDGRYWTNWLFNDKLGQLPTNYSIAYYRLQSLMKKLNGNPQMKQHFIDTFREQEESGMIEAVTTKTDNIVSYVPYQVVTKEDSATTKHRIVYDCSAKARGGLSINDAMYAGPMLLPRLCGVLIRFRFAKFAVSSDVRQAFLQVGLHEKSRDVVRFLSPKDWARPIDHDNIRVLRFRRMCFGATCAPTLLALVINHHLQQLDYGKKLSRDIYVDNVFEKSNYADQLVQQCRKTKEHFQSANLTLRQYFSNSEAVMQQFNDDAINNLPDHCKVLGHQWKFRQDDIIIAWPTWEAGSPITKRTMLSFIGSIYDPTGLISPASLPFKRILQHLWTINVDWDQPVPEEIQTKWMQLISENNNYQFIVRRQAADPETNPRLVLFCDASAYAFGVCAYLVDDRQSHLIMAKSRIFPADNKAMTIPKKEIVALTCAVRIARFLREEIGDQIDSTVTIFGDSMIALQQLSVDDHANTTIFVKNRVAEIGKSRDFIEFRHIDTKLNPADIGSRGAKLPDLTTSSMWLTGPTIIKQQREDWPTTFVLPAAAPDHEQQTASISAEEVGSEDLSNLFSRFNQWTTLTNAVKHLLRFAHKFSKLRNFEATNDDAGRLVIRHEQRLHHPSAALQKKLGLFLCERGIFRVRTRLQDDTLAYDTRFPIWIPNDSAVLALIVQHHHELNYHSNARTTTTDIRQKYWLSYRQTKTICKRCVKCRPFNAQPFPMPIFSQYPKFRTQVGKAFETIGVDLAGPFRTADGPAYLGLITCLKCRAVHLELLRNMSTNEVLNMMQRFMARRGTPTLVLSDNARYFLLARKIFLENNDGKHEWIFITPRAPHEGGIYERLNRNIKDAVRRTIGRQKINFLDLETLIIAIEGSLNNRPLLTVDDDPENYRVLRPADFLHPKVEYKEANGLHEPDDTAKDPDFIMSKSTATELRRYYNKMNANVEKCWQQWQSQYLFTIADNAMNRKAAAEHREPIVGEVVLIADGERPRNEWRLARVHSLIRSPDHVVRRCRLILPNRKIAIRIISQLHPLEVGGSSSEDELPFQVEKKDDATPPPRKQPTRKAKTTKGSTTATFLSTLAVITLAITCTMFGTTAAQKPLMCHSSKNKLLWKMPELTTCNADRISDNGTPKKIRVAIYKKNHIKYHGSGFMCRLTSVTVKEQTLINGNPLVEQIENPATDLDEAECFRMIEKRTCKEGSLLKSRHTYQTTNRATNNPPNRFSSLFGTRDTTVRNCLLIETSIYAHFGSDKATSTLGDLSSCSYDTGKCRTAPNELFVWHPNRTQHCSHVRYYENEALELTNDNAILLEGLHSMLTYDSDPQPIYVCGEALIPTHQGFAFKRLRLEKSSKPREAAQTTTTTRTALASTQRSIFATTKTKPSTPTASTTKRTTTVTSASTTKRTTTVPPASTAKRTTTVPPASKTKRTTSATRPTTTLARPSNTSLGGIQSSFNKKSPGGQQVQLFGLAILYQKGADREQLIQAGYDPAVVDHFLKHAHKLRRNQRDASSNEEGEVDADLQFLEHTTLSKMRKLAVSICTVVNAQIRITENLLRDNPTAVLRAHWHKDNVYARPLSRNLSEVTVCHALNSTEYEVAANPKTCDVAIRLLSTHALWYFNPSSHLLTPQPTMTNSECEDNQMIVLEGKILDYDRMNGTLTPTTTVIHDEMKSAAAEDWTFLAKEMIFRKVFLHDQETTLDSVIEELEKTAEANTEAVPKGVDGLQHHDLQSDLEEFWLPYVWFERVRRTWVSAIAMFWTIRFLFWIKEQCQGRPTRRPTVINILDRAVTTATAEFQQAEASVSRPKPMRKKKTFKLSRSHTGDEALEMTSMPRAQDRTPRRSSLVESLLSVPTPARPT